MLFVDASALVKRYVREAHSTRVRRLLASGPVAVSRWSEIEVTSALARLAREGGLTAAARDRARKAMIADLDSWHIVELVPAVFAVARALLVRHALRSGDAIQLASATWLRQFVPVTGVLAFDARLVEAAKAEGFPSSIAPGRRGSRRP